MSSNSTRCGQHGVHLLQRWGHLLLTMLVVFAVSAASGGQSVESGATAPGTSDSLIPKAGDRFKECEQCPEMVVVPSGSFRAHTEVEVVDSEERPSAQKYVQQAEDIPIDHAFAVARYPVTRGEYAAFVRETNRQSADGCKVWPRGGTQWIRDYGASWRNAGFPQTDQHPVVCVSWEDAQAYLRWLNSKARGVPRLYDQGLGPYRLLSWDEARYAQGAGAKTRFYWGEQLDRRMANYGAEGCDPCRGMAEGPDRWIYTSPVGAFPPNAFGLYDMAGNVWELTDSWIPRGKTLATAVSRAVFGGSWLDNPDRLRTGAWLHTRNVDHVADIGFRIARSIGAQQLIDTYAPHLDKNGEPTNNHSSAGASRAEAGPRAATVGSRFRDCPLCPEMVMIPPGTFYTKFDENSEPVEISIAKPFSIGVYDITREQYAQFVKETARSGGEGCQITEDGFHWAKKQDVTWDYPGFAQTNRDPVVCVSWDDARAYVQWLNAKTIRRVGDGDPSKGPYRLPSAEEWEYAARGGSINVGQALYWGDEISHDRANFGLDLCGQCGGERQGRDRWLYTSPVGSFPPNAFGLFDAYGNVWQFTEDCYHEDGKGMPTDGSAWVTDGDCSYRVARGASFDDSGIGNYFNPFHPATRNNANGFRVVRADVEQNPHAVQ
jgi:formylglycine-generating enzyme required for sulfatase activity